MSMSFSLQLRRCVTAAVGVANGSSTSTLALSRAASASAGHSSRRLRLVVAAALVYAAWYLTRVVRTPSLHYKSTAFNCDMILRCPRLRTNFWPTWWLSLPGLSAHVQVFLYVLWLKLRPQLTKLRPQTFSLEDGGEVLLDWLEHKESSGVELPAEAPICIVLHGVGGRTNDMADFMRALAEAGIKSVSMVRRGHFGSPIRTPRVSIFGDAHDLRQVVAEVQRRRPDAPLAMIGLSAGSALLVRYLGEEGDKTPIKAATCLSPGYDLSVCFKRCQGFYDKFLTRSMRNFFLLDAQNKEVLEAEHPEAFKRALQASSTHDLAVEMAPLAGYRDWEHYLEHVNPILVAHQITCPILIINALDDPICAAQNVHDHKWLGDHLEQAILCVTELGSHCAYFEGTRARLWQVEMSVEYLKAALVKQGLMKD